MEQIIEHRVNLIETLKCDELEFEKHQVDCHNKKHCDVRLWNAIDEIEHDKCGIRGE